MMLSTKSTATLDQRSKELRKTILKTLAAAGRGHLGPAFSIVEIVRALYDHVLRFDPTDPHWPERDRFILSKGHGCVALYVMLVDKGFFPEDYLWSLCKVDGLLAGHPEHYTPGIEASTGALGHGLSIGIGMALHAKIKRTGRKVFVLMGDGEINEGSVWEAAMSASKHKLENLTAIIDYNKSQAYGSTREVLDLEPLVDKWRAFGFSVKEVDGHDMAALRDVLGNTPATQSKPTALICHTVKGKGIPLAESNQKWHHKSKIGEDEIGVLIEALEA
ncbi:Transketolase, N-terminal section [hydrothermal vent metagenome]|uniref:Transketolase, N-terminal section n=1 Tax=hydrothermal vent metagenome TaxID=652676 RepID=A0A3B1CX48_9ZZZZ